MTLEEAIKMALEYENRVRDFYFEAAHQATDDLGKRMFQVLGNEEQGHVDYLDSRLEEWQTTGQVTAERLETVVPSPNVIESGVARLDSHMQKVDRGSELEVLSKALQLEIETSDFYRRMVEELGEEGKLFARFLEIEDGHRAIVQAEIDYLNQTGFFFDFQEFKIES